MDKYDELTPVNNMESFSNWHKKIIAYYAEQSFLISINQKKPFAFTAKTHLKLLLPAKTIIMSVMPVTE